jgi:hypothetical protein
MLSTARKLSLLAGRHVKSGHVPSAESQMSSSTMINLGNAGDAGQCVTVGGSARRSTGRSTSPLVYAYALLDGNPAFPEFFSSTVLARCSVFGWTWGEAGVGHFSGMYWVFLRDTYLAGTLWSHIHPGMLPLSCRFISIVNSDKPLLGA